MNDANYRAGVGSAQIAMYNQRRALTHLTLAEAAAILGITATSLLMYTQRQTTGEKFFFQDQPPEGRNRLREMKRLAAQQAVAQAEAARRARLAQHGVARVTVAGHPVSLPAAPWDMGAQVQP